MSYAELYETETATAAEPPAVEKTSAIAAGIVSVQGEVAKFDQIAAGLAAIEAAHPKNVIVAAIETPAGMKLAEGAWRAYRNPRLEVERARKAAKAPVLALGKAIDTFAGGLENRLRAGEDHYKAQIDTEEARRAAIKAEQERIEAEKAAAHVARLVLLGSYLTRCQEPGMTAERIQRGLGMLSDADVSDPDETRAAKLVEVRDGVMKTMLVLHAQAVAREAEAARQEAIRVENARVAAELAAERQRIEAQAAEVRRQQAALDAQRAEAERIAREAEDALVASLHENSRRIEGRAVAYVQKAITYFETAARDWENDERPRVREAVGEGRRYLAVQLAAAMDTERDEAAAADLLRQARELNERNAAQEFTEAPEPTGEGKAATPGAGNVETAPITGTPYRHLAQDMSRDLTQALASKPDAMLHAREAAAAIEAAQSTPPTELQALAAEARASRFPSEPKMAKAWWARFYALADDVSLHSNPLAI